jgi:hypothetical protein
MRSPRCRCSRRKLRSGREFAAELLPRDDQLHDLSSSVADLQAEHVAQPLLDRQLGAVAVLAVPQQVLPDDVGGDDTLMMLVGAGPRLVS